MNASRALWSLVALLVAGASACRGDVRREETWSDDDRTFYALGAILARRASHFAPSQAELAIVKRAVADTIRGLPAPVSTEAQQNQVEKLAALRLPRVAAAARVEGERALARAALQPNAVTTSTGVVRRTLSAGTGPSPDPSSKVRMRHETRLPNGALLIGRKPEVVDIAASIPCLKETLPTMKVGETVRVTCPAAQAFGEAGQPPRIPPSAVLISTVELLEIVKPDAVVDPAVVARGKP